MTGTAEQAVELLRRGQVLKRTGLCRSSVYDAMDRGDFPRPVKISAKAVAWRSDEVQAWIESRVRTAGPRS